MSLVRSIIGACRSKIGASRKQGALDPVGGVRFCRFVQLSKKILEFSMFVYKAAMTVLGACRRAIWRLETLRWLTIVSASFLAACLLTPAPCPVYLPALGQPAPDTVVSPISYKVIDQTATQINRCEVLKSVRPVYDFDDGVIQDTLSRISTAFGSMRDCLADAAAHHSWESRTPPPSGWMPGRKSSESDSFRALDDTTMKARFEDALGARVPSSSFKVLKSKGFSTSIQADLRTLVISVLLRGVVARSDLVSKDGNQGVLLRTKSTGRFHLLRNFSNMLDVTDAISYINSWKNDPVQDNALSRAIRLMAMDLVDVNVTYDPQQSLSVRQAALVSEKPEYFEVASGEPIVRKGEPINAGHLKKLLGLYRATPPYSHYMILTGLTLVLIFLFKLCFSFCERYLGRARDATKDVFLICLLFLGATVMVRVFASLSPLWSATGGLLAGMSALYAAPVAAAAMLAALRTDARVGFVFAVLVSATSALAVHGNAYLFLFYFVSGIVGLHGITRIIVRTSILRAGALVGLVNVVSLLGIKMALGKSFGLIDLCELGFGFAGGILSGLLVSGLSPLLEPLGHITNVRLIKIADLNHPLLKKMALDAPATYHHSMMVANLAEVAAPQICANTLLARVGALYHDIGRVGQNAKRFSLVENGEQKRSATGKPNLSVNVGILLSHVERGVAQAKEFRLGQPIIDIIQQHHGTNAVNPIFPGASDKDEQQDSYRYPGPCPRTKESALVMLADTVETRWRTMPDPTPASTKKLVQTLVLRLLLEGQLDQSTLTLKDLEAITNAFTRTLQGIRHPRTEYSANTGSRRKLKRDPNCQQTHPNSIQYFPDEPRLELEGAT
jgi:cyclic-di-AMP phosphodiesterase PgpH